MCNIKVKTNKSGTIEEWMGKEYGSFEDSKHSDTHVYAILSRFGGTSTFTEEEAQAIIKSGLYHATAWNDDEIGGGRRTKSTILKYVTKFQAAIH